MLPGRTTCQLRPGDVIHRKYEITNTLGSGGFGTVYSARNLNLGTRVAIKVRHHRGCDSRVRREAQLAASLRSPYSMRVFDVDELSDGTAFIVMEYLEGETLRDYLKQHGPVSAPLAIEWALQACAALKEAHAMGLVHRDIKPSNLFLVRSPNVEPHIKLVDFGLAKSLVDDGTDSITETGMVVGSPAYMAPERIRSDAGTALSDIWSVGVVLFEMVSGTLPFTGEGKSAMLAAIAADPPRSLREVVPCANATLVAIVAKCLRKRPEDRFSSISEVSEALRGLARTPSDLERSQTLSQTLEPVLRTPASTHKTRRWALAVLSVCGIMGLAWLSQKAIGPQSLSPGTDEPSAAGFADGTETSRVPMLAKPAKAASAAKAGTAAPALPTLTPPSQLSGHLRPQLTVPVQPPITPTRAVGPAAPASPPLGSATAGLFKEPDF